MSIDTQIKAEKLFRLHELGNLLGISKSTLYAGMKAGTFPRPIKIGVRAVAWTESSIAEWQAERQSAD